MDDTVRTWQSPFIPSSTTPPRCGRHIVIVAEGLAERVGKRYAGLRPQGRNDEGRAVEGSASATRSTTVIPLVCSPITSRSSRAWRRAHGARHAPRLPDRQEYGGDLCPVGPSGHFLETVLLFGGSGCSTPTGRRKAMEERGRLCIGRRSRTNTRTVALPQSGDLLATSQWFVRMDGDR